MRNLTAIAFAVAVCGAALPLPRGNAAAVELHILTAGAVQEGEKKLADEYRHMTGNRVTFISGTVGQIQERLKNREAVDVIVVSKPAMEQLDKAGEIRPSASAVLGRIGIGVAAKEGSTIPDIGTSEKFKAAMLKARSITYMDPAAGASSGIATAKILRDLGIADDM